MDIEKVFSLIDKAEKSSFNKIKIQMEDVKLCLEREASGTVVQAEPAKKESFSSYQHEYDEENIIFAPISGVFYVAKEPGTAPFVKEGAKVNKGDAICIIEAMKMMNEICAPKSGVIESILKADGETVAEKDPLFRYAEEK